MKSGPYTSWRLVLFLPHNNKSYVYELWNGYSALVAFMIFASLMSGYVTAQYLQNKKLADYHIYHLAHTDALTGLENRMSFEKKTQTALSSNKGGYLVYLDLDDFKCINDRLGHAAGDAVLLHIADALRTTFCDSAILGRLGGDEFVAYVSETKSMEEIEGT